MVHTPASSSGGHTRHASTKATLAATLRPHWVYAMAVGSEIGWGAFILPYDWLRSSGIGGIICGFVIATLLVLVIGLNYGEAIRALPQTGGGILFAISAVNRTAGFVVGWALTLGYAGIVALNASAMTLIFRLVTPGLLTHIKLYSVAGWDVYLPEVAVAIAFIAVFAYLNIRGFSFSGRFQFICVVVLLVAVAVLCVSVGYSSRSLSGVHIALFPNDTSHFAAIFGIVAIAPWAYVGFDSLPQLAGEFDFSPRKARGLLVTGIVSASLVYVVMSLVSSLSMGNDLDRFASEAWPTGSAVSGLVGGFGLVLMVCAVTAGVVTGLNGFTASASRVLYTMGTISMISPRFAAVDAKYRTPKFAIFFVAAVCAISPWFGRAALTWVVDMTSVGIAVAYLSASFFRFRLSRGDELRGVSGVHASRGGEILGILGCAISIFFMLLLLVPGMPGALGVPSLIALGVWVCVGIAVHSAYHTKMAKIPDKDIFDQAS